MNRLLLWLLVTGLAASISACDKTEVTPLPRTGAGEVKQQAREAAGAVQNAAIKEKDAFVAAVENDVQATKAKIGDLKGRIANATGKAKAAMEQPIAALEDELKVAQRKLTDLKSATAEKWQDLRQGVSSAIDHLKQAVRKAQKESA